MKNISFDLLPYDTLRQHYIIKAFEVVCNLGPYHLSNIHIRTLMFG